jgi:hypothetical protein
VWVTFSLAVHRNNFLCAGLSVDGVWFPVKETDNWGSYVQVHSLLYEVADGDLAALLRQYGKVLGVRRVYDNELHWFDNGSRVVRIVRKHHIPRDLRLRGFYFTVFYRGQPVQCTICGEQSHRARDCPHWGKCHWCGEKGHLERNCKYSHDLSSSGES